MYTFDYPLFLSLNFDGGPIVDQVMETISGTIMWIPLYVGIIAWIWYSKGWKYTLAFVLCLAVAMGVADMLCGIFKHSGLLKHLWESFPPRPRPMFEPALQGLVHVPSYAHGPYGTVSSHAATVAALTVMSASVIYKKWFIMMMVAITLLICYSRIYLACHYPADIVLGLAVGIASAYAIFPLYKKTVRTIEKYS